MHMCVDVRIAIGDSVSMSKAFETRLNSNRDIPMMHLYYSLMQCCMVQGFTNILRQQQPTKYRFTNTHIGMQVESIAAIQGRMHLQREGRRTP